MTDFGDLVAEYGLQVKAKLAGPGGTEALISAPAARMVESLGTMMGHDVVAHDQVTEQDGTVRPDFGVRRNGLLIGHIELKAPGTSLDPDTYSRGSHNAKQWERLRNLPNLLHTNGSEWRLWRYGEMVFPPVAMHTASLAAHVGILEAPERLETVMRDFLLWKPAPINSVTRLVNVVAPLAQLLKAEVVAALRAERRAVQKGDELESQPFLGIARDWRALLFPRATTEEFADGFAQTVVFALILAISEDLDLADTGLHELSEKLENRHSLMGRALDLLTEHIKGTPTYAAVELIASALSAVNWERVSGGSADVYLHLYEHFLASYDPEKRRKTGSYYTPIEIVDFMVRIADEALVTKLNRREGLRNPNVSIVDPAMGTGTYPISVLTRIASAAAAAYGTGAASEAAASAIERLYGIEIQSGPFSVAELRIASALRDLGTDVPRGGLNMYVADTLEDPQSSSSSQLSYTLQLIARQRRLANEMKREKNIQVCIGNPPYKDHAGGLGGWIENGKDPHTGRPPLDAFRSAGNGIHERHLSNLYAYFWRWATWKVFESTNDPDIRDGGSGVICFITATGYLTGQGFKGMREYLRRMCSHGWIINVTPEGLRPPKENAVFNIGTPVAIGLFVRGESSDYDTPADIRYIDVHGTRDEKFATLADLTIEDARFREARKAWTAPFTPEPETSWDENPAVADLMPFNAKGVLAGRTWVYSSSRPILEQRFRELTSETDMARKRALLSEGTSVALGRTKSPLHGDDVEKNTFNPLSKEGFEKVPVTVPVLFRAFDRQWLIADKRLLMRDSPTLWMARIPSQTFVIEQHAHHPGQGPGLIFSSLIPDVHAFNNRGGQVSPALHPDGTSNVAPGLLEALGSALGHEVLGEEVVAYMAAIAAHPGYVSTFEDELFTPGIRIPMTADAGLWAEAVELGNKIIAAHKFKVTPANTEADLTPVYVSAVGHAMPKDMAHDATSLKLEIGDGVWENVLPEVRGYAVGGVNVLDSWFGYRCNPRRGRKSSELDDIRATTWQAEWSIELTEMLRSLSVLVSMENLQADLLERVLAAPLVTRSGLEAAGVRWPDSEEDRRPRVPSSGLW